jgi:NAD(P)-dependent dehydrogenase (short-subunit alcohol dehydrogenase family)
MLTDHVVAVTGGFGQLGTAVARTLSEHGARVALIDRAAIPTNAPTAALLLPGVDLTSSDGAANAIDHVARQLGRLDALVNIAGGFRWETLEGGSIDTWDFLYQLNVRTAVVTSKAALPHLLARGAGRIVNIGAMGAIKAGAGMGPYAASKAAVAKLTESLAEELKDRGVNVNAILPSIIDTPQNRADMPDADVTRWVTPRAIADVVAFLLSEAARAVTGALIPVAGRA